MTNATRISLGSTDLSVHPLCLGGNVFGWTADRETSFRILDAYVSEGGNFFDTADGYSRWVPGHSGGESETIIGEWLRTRSDRDDLVISTKVFGHPEFKGLGGANIKAACEASLRRLQTDHIDVYYAHHDDPDVPMEESLSAFSELVDAGKVRVLGASNFSAERLREARELSEQHSLASYQVSQDHYNLMERGYETRLRPVLEQYGMAEVPYYALASGFLSGKYRPGSEQAESGRGGAAGRWLKGHCSEYLDDRGLAVLDVLDELAAKYDAAVASIALAWLAAQPTVGAVIASARTPEQLPALVGVAQVSLTGDEVARLTSASAPAENHVTPGQ
ncbi:MAG: aldo/keto reductase [Microbacteriaceae bacterium]|nr:aldo/keto reductase [Microbacteriaceae bacterium]